MKSVLISIKPQWVEKIVNGEKTIELRKSRPKIETPFKCYIYATKSRDRIVLKDDRVFEISKALTGKVIGEFVCDRVYKWECKNRLEILESFPTWRASYMLFVDDLEKTCLTYDDLWDYGKGKPLYGWHISDLKIYDKPKELSEFNRPCSYAGLCFSCDRAKFTSKGDRICQAMITRPPQSYMYVEEI